MNHKSNRIVNQRLTKASESLEDCGRQGTERIEDDHRGTRLHDAGRKRHPGGRMEQHLDDRTAECRHSERARDRDDHRITGRGMHRPDRGSLIPRGNCRCQGRNNRGPQR